MNKQALLWLLCDAGLKPNAVERICIMSWRHCALSEFIQATFSPPARRGGAICFCFFFFSNETVHPKQKVHPSLCRRKLVLLATKTFHAFRRKTLSYAALRRRRFSSVVFLTVDYVAAIVFHFTGIGWNSFPL